MIISCRSLHEATWKDKKHEPQTEHIYIFKGKASQNSKSHAHSIKREISWKNNIK